MEFRMEHKQIDRWTCGLNKKVQEGTTREFKSSRGVRERVWEGGSTGERKYGREGVDTEGSERRVPALLTDTSNIMIRPLPEFKPLT